MKTSNEVRQFIELLQQGVSRLKEAEKMRVELERKYPGWKPGNIVLRRAKGAQ